MYKKIIAKLIALDESIDYLEEQRNVEQDKESRERYTRRLMEAQGTKHGMIQALELMGLQVKPTGEKGYIIK